MLGVILNEQEIANKLISGEDVDEITTYNKMVILVKYFLRQGVNTELELQEQTLETLKKAEDGFRRINWEEKTLDTVKRLIRKRNGRAGFLELTDINKISITQKEIDFILTVKSKADRKLLFIMLLYAKINNIIFHSTEGWFYQPKRKNIFKEAKVTGCRTDKEKCLAIHKFIQEGYITNSKKVGNLSLKVNFIDKEENPKIAFEVTDLADCHAIYSYLIYIGEKWKLCKACGEKYFKLKTANSNQKYCSACAKKIKLEQTKELKQRAKLIKND